MQPTGRKGATLRWSRSSSALWNVGLCGGGLESPQLMHQSLANANGGPGMAVMIELFENIRSEFPALRMELDRATGGECGPKLGDPTPARARLRRSLNQQGDELHLVAGCFWLEWFPCDDDKIAAAYRDAVVGLLAGRYRIVEHYRGDRCVKAELQRPTDDQWQTIGTWENLLGRLYWGRSASARAQRTLRTLRNEGLWARA